MEETVDDLLRAAELSELSETANERREKIASDLERLAMDIRIDRHNPLVGFVILIEPDKTTLNYAGDKVEWEDVDEALYAFMDARKAKYQTARGKGQNKWPDQYVVDGSIQRKVLKEMEERKKAAHTTEFAYKCPHCDYRSKTTRGRDQHVRNQVRDACVECHRPRCEVLSRGGGGASIDYSTNYKGIMTCVPCIKKRDH